MLQSKNFLPLIYLASACVFFPVGLEAQANELNLQTNQTKTITVAQRTSRLRFRLPNRGVPGARIGGATRAGSKTVTAIVPEKKLGLTASDAPTLFVYIPEHESTDAQLIISNDKGEKVYTSNFTPPQESGILRIKLPESVALENNQMYKWEVKLKSQKSDPMSSLKLKTSGWVEKVAVENVDNNQEEWDKLNTLAEAGIWHDTLDTLASMKLANPSDETIQNEWNQLLEDVGLEGFTDANIISKVVQVN